MQSHKPSTSTHFMSLSSLLTNEMKVTNCIDDKLILQNQKYFSFPSWNIFYIFLFRGMQLDDIMQPDLIVDRVGRSPKNRPSRDKYSHFLRKICIWLHAHVYSINIVFSSSIVGNPETNFDNICIANFFSLTFCQDFNKYHYKWKI